VDKLQTGCVFDILADPTERNDLAATIEGKAFLATLVARQQEIGTHQHSLSPWQCHHHFNLYHHYNFYHYYHHLHHHWHHH
jgi:hypothetical protein